MKKWVRPITAVALLLGLSSPACRAVDLVAGPMVGHVTDRSVRVWMQFPVAGDVTIMAYDVEHHQNVFGMKTDLEGPTPFVLDVPINNLLPNSSYRIEVKFDGQPVKLPEAELRTAPSAGDEVTMSLAFGSGILMEPLPAANVAATQAAPVVKQQNMQIFRNITAAKPRAFFFLGNIGTLPARLEDLPTTRRATLRYLMDFQSLMRRQTDMQELLRTTPTYAVLGERDYGCAGSDGAFVFAPESLLAFQRFWPNAEWGTPEDPGCYSNATFGDVDVFLLDTRTYRTPKAMLGEPQLNWLKKNLKASKATFKVVASAATLWGDDAQTPEADSWSRFPEEQKAFLQWLVDNDLRGLIGVAGNQAAGQITKLDRTAGHGGYPLFSLGVSTLLGPQGPAAKAADNAHRMGAAVVGDTFGTLDFAGAREHRTMTLRVRDSSGKVRAEQVVVASQLVP